MIKSDCEVITELEAILTRQRYSPVVVRNYCTYARDFADHLAHRNILIADVTEAQLEQYLREAVALFQRRHGRLPGPRWHQTPCAGIHALLRLVRGRWPPAPDAACAADALKFAICDEYETWLHEERGLARSSIDALLWEARHFLTWHLERCGAEGLMDLSVSDIILLAFDEWLHVGGWDEPHVMSKLADFPAPEMGPTTCLHRDKTGLQLVEELQHLRSP